MKPDAADVSSEPVLAEPCPGSDAIVQRSIPLSGEHRLLIEQRGDVSSLRLVGANGRLALTISITESGPVVHLDGNVALEASGTLDLVAERVAVRTRDGIVLETAGDLILKSEREIALEAEGDVAVQGENVRLNC